MRAHFSILVVAALLAACEREQAVAVVEDPPKVVITEEMAAQWTSEAFAALSGRLAEAISKGGHVAAIEVCSVEASDLMGEVAKSHGASIRRVTDRPRNPKNVADSRDVEVMEMMRKMLELDEMPGPVKENGVVRLPIRIAMPLCLTCHGNEETEIAAATLVAIRFRYPDDMATRYQLGELRGLWRVEMTDGKN